MFKKNLVATAIFTPKVFENQQKYVVFMTPSNPRMNTIEILSIQSGEICVGHFCVPIKTIFMRRPDTDMFGQKVSFACYQQHTGFVV
jgi:hypothetical protein